MRSWLELFPKTYLPRGAEDARFLRSLCEWGRLGEAVDEAGITLPLRAAQRVWREKRWEWRFNEQYRAEPAYPHFTVAIVGGVLDYAFDGVNEVNAEIGTFAWLGKKHKAERNLNDLQREFLWEKLTPEDRDSLFAEATWETLKTCPPEEDWTAYLRRRFYELAHRHVFQERGARRMDRLDDESRESPLPMPASPDFSDASDEWADLRKEAERNPTLSRAIDALERGQPLAPDERQSLSRLRRRLRK